MTPPETTFEPTRHRFAIVVAFATFLLIGIGGLVTSHGVGMAVPDWPNTFGYNMFFFPISQWIGGVLYEHTHRLAASAVGLLTVILAIWLYGRSAQRFTRWMGLVLLAAGVASWLAFPKRYSDALVLVVTGGAFAAASFAWPRAEPAPRWLRRMGVIAVVAVISQGILGGLRVTAAKDELGIFHATLAQLFFLLMSSIALFTSRWWHRQPVRLLAQSESGVTATWPFARRLVLITTGLILLQLIIAATMRHQHAGLSIPDFPLAYGKVWPAMDPAAIESYNRQRMETTSVNPITAFQIGLQMAHRMVALLIFALVLVVAWGSWKGLGSRALLTRWSFGWVMAILAQIGLGAWTIWSNKAADIATAHVLLGALSLAIGAFLCIVSFCNRVPSSGKDLPGVDWAVPSSSNGTLPASSR